MSSDDTLVSQRADVTPNGRRRTKGASRASEPVIVHLKHAPNDVGRIERRAYVSQREDPRFGRPAGQLTQPRERHDECERRPGGWPRSLQLFESIRIKLVHLRQSTGKIANQLELIEENSDNNTIART